MTGKVVEILQYNLKEGTGEAFHQIMQQTSVPLHASHSIEVILYGNSLHDSDCYYLIRAFESEDQMHSVLNDFYAGKDWKDGPREEIVNKIENSLKSILLLSQSSIEELKKQNFVKD
ncbi:hypothetical protein [Chryseobacterium sp. CT-SW4]|uniref:hypothetical protein n=1 Tax=Chryseobacterium sp. SW-1 TaxID=3157343 RepID=UPI003B02CDBA